MLNLHPGEAIFQDAGLPHAYLEGQNVEIMANSDNVLRGGLTPKHVDVAELLKHVQFEPTEPRIMAEERAPGHITVYHTPAPDFELSKISLMQGESITVRAHTVDIFIVSGREGWSRRTERFTFWPEERGKLFGFSPGEVRAEGTGGQCGIQGFGTGGDL